jgi:hypothetical protein
MSAWYYDPDPPANFTAAGGETFPWHSLERLATKSGAAKVALALIDYPARLAAYLLAEGFALVALMAAAGLGFWLYERIRARLGKPVGVVLSLLAAAYMGCLVWRTGYYFSIILIRASSS